MRGRPLKAATAEDAKITPADVKAAREAWKRDAPRPFRNLLDAKETEPNDETQR